MSNTLLPCPFCGGEATISDVGYSGEKFLAHCRELSCLAASGFIRKTQDEAIAAWNRRADHLPDATKMVSNADRIRSMTDDELHKFLLDFEAGDIDYAKTFCDLCCKDAALERKSTDCEGCLLWWLKNDATLPQGIDWFRQPAKEE